MNVLIDGLIINYKIEGRGRAVLCLHGWGDNLDTFTKSTQSGFEDYRLISVDLPGFGKTDTPEKDYNLLLYAEFVNKFLKKVNEEKIYAVIGHSNGGAISIKAVANNLLNPKKMVLLASSGIRSESRSRNKFLRIIAKIAKLFTKLLPKKIREKIRRKVYKKIGSDLFVAEKMQGTFKNIVSEDLLEESRKINIPTLLVYGSEDGMTPLKYGEKYNESIRNSKLEVIVGARHMLHHTHEKETRDIILEFLN
jgi:pimeloyl-ACP methyl ester carboxylesterase